MQKYSGGEILVNVRGQKEREVKCSESKARSEGGEKRANSKGVLD